MSREAHEALNKMYGQTVVEMARESSLKGLKNAGLDTDALKERAKAAYVKKVQEVAAEFIAAHKNDEANPFVPNDANDEIMFDYMESHGMDGTQIHHYELTYAAVRDKLIMPMKRTRTAPAGPKKIGGYEISHEAFDRMTAAQMLRALQSPLVEAAYNALPPRKRK